MDKLTVRDFPLQGKRVLVRVDFNVPLTPAGEVADSFRIQATLPTIKYLQEKQAKIILLSHLGRPKGKPDPQYRLDAVARALAKLTGQEVKKIDSCVGEEAQEAVKNLKPGEILFLENVRFYPEEEKNDPGFAAELASLADVYVNDAFGASHRAHASTVGVTRYLPALAGLLMEKDLTYLGDALASPAKPFWVVLGGAKVADKIGVIEHLLAKGDGFAIGGGMANTFLKAKGFNVGNSFYEEDKIEAAREILATAEEKRVKFLLPVDAVVAPEKKAKEKAVVVKVEEVPPEGMVLDIGPETTREFSQALAGAKTAVWNGPLGVFEEGFQEGTEGVARALAKLTGTTVVGGGDSVAAVRKMGLAASFTHVSTGGGATLDFLAGKKLPGVEAINPKTSF